MAHNIEVVSAPQIWIRPEEGEAFELAQASFLANEGGDVVREMKEAIDDSDESPF